MLTESPRAPGLREVTPEDCRFLWECRNDPQTRAASFSQAEIPYEEHERWFREKGRSPENRIWIVQQGDESRIGYVRFSLRGEEAQISAALERGHRGKGFGTAALRLACERLLLEGRIRRIIAYIKPDNEGSLRAFQRAGFDPLGFCRIQGVQVHCLVRKSGEEIRILFRVEAGPAIGFGHLRRSLSLAAALKGIGLQSVFRLQADQGFLEMISEAGFPSFCFQEEPPWSERDWAETLRIAGEIGAGGIVVDSEEPKAADLERIRRSGLAVILRDDLGRRGTPAVDLLLNANADAEQIPYPDPGPSTQMQIGPRYAVLAPDFLEAPPVRSLQDPPLVLVTLGGADPEGLTVEIVRRLDRIEKPFRMRVVIGPLFPPAEQIRAAAGELRHPVEWSGRVASLRKVLEEADLAVSGAGQTLYETAWAGCPAVAVEMASNQRGQVQALERAGCVIRAGSARENDYLPRIEAAVERLLQDEALRTRMGRAGRALVDGRGAARVAAKIQECVMGVMHAGSKHA